MARHDGTAEDAWGIFILFEANGNKGGQLLFIPVAWDSLQAQQGSYEL